MILRSVPKKLSYGKKLLDDFDDLPKYPFRSIGNTAKRVLFYWYSRTVQTHLSMFGGLVTTVIQGVTVSNALAAQTIKTCSATDIPCVIKNGTS